MANPDPQLRQFDYAWASTVHAFQGRRVNNVTAAMEAKHPHRTVRSKGCLSNKTALAMVFKLAQAAQNSWRRLDGHNQLPKLIVGVKFIDGIEAVRQQPQAAA